VYVVRNGIPKFYLLSVAGVGVVMALLLSAVTGFAQAFSLLLSWITRENLDGGIASLPIWLVIPFLLLPFIFFGLYLLFKNKSYGVLTPIVIGLILWCVYSVVGSVIVIDKSRIVSITTILLMIPLGFGIEYVVNWIKDTRYIPHSSRVALLFKGALLVTFALGAFFYPTSNTWSYFQLNIETEQGMQKFPPSAPITRFLHEDDLIFFSGFSGKVFIAPPWKGLVIGSATGNFPLDTKASTLTNRYVLYSDFMELSCEEKSIVANEYTIEYVYGTRFACEAFEELGRSVENLYMYKYVSKQNEG
jgi:hypothetical protein